MASVWIERRPAGDGKPRYIVKYTLGGYRVRKRYAGSFKTIREATLRKQWVAGELAAVRVPDLTLLAEPALAPTFAEVATRWQASRVDVTDATKIQHRTAVNRIVPLLCTRRVDTLVPQDVADLIASLHADGKARESIRKTVTALAMILDYAGVSPNPARDRVTVKLPREEPEEPNPPTAEDCEAVYRLLPPNHRLAFLFLDWSG